jgi:hypothetical protein
VVIQYNSKTKQKKKKNLSLANMDAPKKYVKIDGIMKTNPEWRKWKEAQGGYGTAATTVPRPSIALPIVSCMEDHAELNDAMTAQGEKAVPLAESTNGTLVS